MRHRSLIACGSLVLFVAAQHSGAQATSPKAALASGDPVTAEKIYRKELLRNPASPELLTDLGIALQMQGRSTEAIVAFRKALKIQYLPATFALLAEERCKLRDLDGARPMLDRILREENKNPQILGIVAPCYLEAEKPLEAVEVNTELLTSPTFPRDLALVNLIRSYGSSATFFVSRLKAAADGSFYLQALANVRNNGDADPRAAFAEAEKRSHFFQPANDFAGALAIWHLHPEDPALLYQLSVLSSEAVLRTFQQCIQEFPESPYLVEFRAEVLADQGRQEDAIAALEGLAASHPEFPDVPYTLGMLYRKQGDWERAAASFRQQVSSNAHDERAAARLSEALLNLSRFEELRIFLTPRMIPGDTPLWARLDMATAEQKLGNSKAAIALMTEAEREEPANPSIHYKLMRLYAQVGDTAGAARESASFRRTKP